MTEVENEPRIGVWIENGLVYRSDIGELRNPYIPLEGHSPEEVAEVMRQIQKVGCEGLSWLETDKRLLDAGIDRLSEIASERSRFTVEEGKNLLSESLR